MEIKLEKNGSTNALLRVTIQEADYAPSVEAKLKEYGRKANFKGFRPGKVPTSLVSKLYGTSIKVDEINNMLAEKVSGYINENKLQVLGEPLPNRDEARSIDWDNQKEFEFSYEIGLAPEFEVVVDKSVKVTGYTVSVSDEVLNERIEDLKQKNNNSEPVEEIQAGDFVYGTITQASTNFNITTLLPLAKMNEAESAKFLGKKANDKVTFDIKNAFASSKEGSLALGITEAEVEKLAGEFELTVENISRKKAAELNQDFFDRVVGKDKVSSEEEFRAELANIIAQQYNNEAVNLIEYQIKEEILNKIQFDLPKEFLMRWLKATKKEDVTDEQIVKEFGFFLKDLRWTLIKNNIIKAQEIKVEKEQVEAKAKENIEQYFAQMGMSGMGDKLDDFVQNFLYGNKDSKNYMDTLEKVMSDKVFDYIKGQISIDHQTVDIKKFEDIITEQNEKFNKEMEAQN